MLGEYDDKEEEDCEHSFIFKDDIGDVCRICGVIKRGIETIIEYNFSKVWISLYAINSLFIVDIGFYVNILNLFPSVILACLEFNR